MKTIFIEYEKTYVKLWDSWTEFCAGACPHGHKHDDAVGGHIGRAEFIGRAFQSWKQVDREASAAWPDGLAAVGKMLDEIGRDCLPPPKSRQRRACWRDDDGDEIDRDRLLSGAAPWRTTRRESRTGPQTLAIVASVTTPGSVDWREILWRGAACVALADLLENAGYRVELYAGDRTTQTYSSGNGQAQMVRLKEAGDPLDPATLTAAMSGWAYRTVWFASAYIPDRAKSHLGNCASIVPALPALLGDLPIVAVAEQLWSHADSVRWIRAALAKINKPAY